MESLYRLCLDFVAKNVHCVETFEGFPELVGFTLVQRVASLRSRHLDDIDPQIVSVFTKGYGPKVLASLQLQRSKLLVRQLSDTANRVNERQRKSLFDCINFSAISRLGLSYNTCCSSPEWLSMIGQCNLTHLSLRGVGLTDRGMSHLTACASIRRSGLTRLKQLDLAENYITGQRLNALCCLDSLNVCDVSFTFIKATQVDSSMWSITRTSLCNVQIENEGWLADNIARRSYCDKTPVASSATFYKSRVTSNTSAQDRTLILTPARKSVKRTKSPSSSKIQSKRSCDNPKVDRRGQQKRTKLNNDILSLYS